MPHIANCLATLSAVLVLAMSLTPAAQAQLPMPQHPVHQHPAHRPAPDALWGTPTPVEYRLLPRPVKPHSHRYEPATPAPTMVSKPIHPYAYGWFGSSTQQHWSRHFGTRNAFTQWTLK